MSSATSARGEFVWALQIETSANISLACWTMVIRDTRYRVQALQTGNKWVENERRLARIVEEDEEKNVSTGTRASPRSSARGRARATASPSDEGGAGPGPIFE